MRHRPGSLARLCLVLPLALLSTGCIFGRPNNENVRLRKEVQRLQDEVTSLQQRQKADEALIHAMRASSPGNGLTHAGGGAAPASVDQLFTTRGLKFGRLTGGHDANRDAAGHEGIKVYVVPTDQDGQPLKAAGSFKIEVFDLARPESPLVGTWTFDIAEARKNWYGTFLDYTYAFTLPWQQVPRHPDLTVRVHFTEGLTGLSFDAQKEVRVDLPNGGPTTAPTTGPG